MTRVFDFDNTIYRGDSTARFCVFSMTRRLGLLIKMPKVAMAFLAMAIGLISKTTAKERLYIALLSGYDGIKRDVEEFWRLNYPRIKSWYTEISSKDDIIISASPEFLLETPCKMLGVKLIASKVDVKTGKYSGLNCHGAEKVRRYTEEGMPERFEFYSDSASDEPMARIAEKAFLVKGDKVTLWDLGGKNYANSFNKG